MTSTCPLAFCRATAWPLRSPPSRSREIGAPSLGLLRAYVRSLGGDIELAATFADRRILL